MSGRGNFIAKIRFFYFFFRNFSEKTTRRLFFSSQCGILEYIKSTIVNGESLSSEFLGAIQKR